MLWRLRYSLPGPLPDGGGSVRCAVSACACRAARVSKRFRVILQDFARPRQYSTALDSGGGRGAMNTTIV